jgi:hypothetical protein
MLRYDHLNNYYINVSTRKISKHLRVTEIQICVMVQYPAMQLHACAELDVAGEVDDVGHDVHVVAPVVAAEYVLAAHDVHAVAPSNE